MSDDVAKRLAKQAVDEMVQPRTGQIYKHWKGSLYSVHCVSIREFTLEILVTYSSNKHGGLTTRTLANFTESVSLPDGSLVRRFERVEG